MYGVAVKFFTWCGARYKEYNAGGVSLRSEEHNLRSMYISEKFSKISDCSHPGPVFTVVLIHVSGHGAEAFSRKVYSVQNC